MAITGIDLFDQNAGMVGKQVESDTHGYHWY